MLIGHLHIFFREVSVQVICQYFKLFVFLLLRLKSSSVLKKLKSSSVCILNIKLLSDI